MVKEFHIDVRLIVFMTVKFFFLGCWWWLDNNILEDCAAFNPEDGGSTVL